MSTLLADYTSRNAVAAGAAATTPHTGPGTGGTAFQPLPSRASKKRGRNANANSAAAAAAVLNNSYSEGRGNGQQKQQQYPSGKLEADREPPLFASSTRDGRKMVSVMTTVGKTKRKGGGDGTVGTILYNLVSAIIAEVARRAYGLCVSLSY